MSQPVRRRGEREHFWRQAIADWKRSGQSVSVFCSARQLSQPSFYAWRRELDRREQRRWQTPTPAFVPVQVVDDAVLEVVLPSGLRVRVPEGSDELAVARLVAALGNGSC